MIKHSTIVVVIPSEECRLDGAEGTWKNHFRTLQPPPPLPPPHTHPTLSSFTPFTPLPNGGPIFTLCHPLLVDILFLVMALNTDNDTETKTQIYIAPLHLNILHTA